MAWDARTGVALASIDAINGVAIASVAEVNGVAKDGGGGGATYGTVSFVQAAPQQDFTGSNRTLTFPGSVTAGNHIIIQASMYEGSGDGVPNSITTSQGTAVLVFQSPQRTELGGFSRATCYLIAGAAGGSGGVTVAGDSPYGACSAIEVSSSNGNLAVLGTPVTAENTGNTPSIGITPSEASVSVLSMAVLTLLSSVTNCGIDAVSGYTNIAIQQNSSVELGVSHDYRIFTTSGAAENVSWGTAEGGGDAWTAGIALFCAPD